MSAEKRETYNKDVARVICPLCQGENDLSESIGSRGEDVCEWRCSECGKTFGVRVHFSISVTAEEQ